MYEKLDAKIKEIIKPTKHIILEGPDNVGKTTIADRIKELYPDMNYEIIHFGRDTENTYDTFTKVMYMGGNFIWDRGPYGQFVYQTTQERKDNGWMTVEDLLKIEKQYPFVKAQIVYVTMDVDSVVQKCKEDEQDSYYTKEYVFGLFNKFDCIFSSISTADIVRFENPYKVDFTEIMGKIDWASVPETWAVDFDNCLALTKFPDIIAPNIELIEDVKEAQGRGVKIILWTTRTDGHLIDAIEFCKKYGLEFDAVNDNIVEEARCRKVFCSKIIDDIAECKRAMDMIPDAKELMDEYMRNKASTT